MGNLQTHTTYRSHAKTSIMLSFVLAFYSPCFAQLDNLPYDRADDTAGLTSLLQGKDMRNAGLVQIDGQYGRDLIITCADFSNYYSNDDPFAAQAWPSDDSPVFIPSELLFEASGSNLEFGASGVIFADFDNDGDLDFYAPNPESNHQLFRFDAGSGHFEDVTESMGLNNIDAGYPQFQNSISGVWGDFNGDSWVDLLILYGTDEEYGSDLQFIWQNDGGNGFISSKYQIPGTPDFNDSERIRSAHWVDFDQDHDLDLLLVQGSSDPDGTRTKYFENKMGLSNSLLQLNSAVISEVINRFSQDRSLSTLADMDNDGYLDVVYENHLGYGIMLYDQGGYLDDTWFLNDWHAEEHPFVWDLASTDVNLNGREDLIVSKFNDDQRPMLYWGQVSQSSGLPILVKNQHFGGESEPHHSHGSCIADFMEDGLTEVFLTSSFNQGTAENYIWDIPNAELVRNWVGFRLSSPHEMTTSDAIGTILKVRSRSETWDNLQAKVVDGGNGYASQRDMYLQYGLDTYSGPVNAVAVLPNKNASRTGSTIYLRDVPSGQYWDFPLDAIFGVSTTFSYDVQPGTIILTISWYSHEADGQPEVSHDQVNFHTNFFDSVDLLQITYQGGGTVVHESGQERYFHEMVIDGLPCDGSKKFYFSVQSKSGDQYFGSDITSKVPKTCVQKSPLPPSGF